MLRCFGAFLVVFSGLSLVVRMYGMFEWFSAVALALFAFDFAITHWASAPRVVRTRDEQRP
jgi:hypothetical protein